MQVCKRCTTVGEVFPVCPLLRFLRLFPKSFTPDGPTAPLSFCTVKPFALYNCTSSLSVRSRMRSLADNHVSCASHARIRETPQHAQIQFRHCFLGRLRTCDTAPSFDTSTGTKELRDGPVAAPGLHGRTPSLHGRVATCCLLRTYDICNIS